MIQILYSMLELDFDRLWYLIDFDIIIWLLFQYIHFTLIFINKFWTSLFLLLFFVYFCWFVLLFCTLYRSNRPIRLATVAMDCPQTHFVIFYKFCVLPPTQLALHEFCDVFLEQILHIFLRQNIFNHEPLITKRSWAAS